MLGEISGRKFEVWVGQVPQCFRAAHQAVPTGGWFFGDFFGVGNGRGSSPLLPGRTSPSFQMKRSRKRRKRRLLLLWSVKSLPIFWRFFFGVGGILVGFHVGLFFCGWWSFPVEVWHDLLRPDLFLWCRNAAGIARWMKMSLKWVSGSSTRCNCWQVPMAIPALQRASRRVRCIGWPVLPQHSKVKAGMDLKGLC